ncbi:MAG: PTS cellobiose transporter subunit IIB [Erysipelotrichaceae bacterium]|nr:PTS cellobiose transporter subunit IIB [Erysipelotrichaceae bacterium]
MKRILIICAAGMSSSLFAKKAGITLSSRGMDVEVEARCMTEGEDLIRKNSYDLYLVSPQARVYIESFKKAAGKSGAVILEIPPASYVPIPAGFEKFSAFMEEQIKSLPLQ